MATNAPPSGVLSEIEALFSWNPPLLYSTKKPSTTSRVPGFYDKHFSPTIVLKKVVRLPSLVQDLARNVDRALCDASPTLPPLAPAFTRAEFRDVKTEEGDRVANNENAVANCYDKYTDYFLPVASTLALHPAASFSKWSSLLFWTQSVSSSGYAIMDGELRFKHDIGVGEKVRSHRADIMMTMEEGVRFIYEQMRDSGLGLATWEIKAIGAGSSEVMAGVPNLGTFAWTYCNVAKCQKLRKHREELKKAISLLIGPDAQRSPWVLPSTVETNLLAPTKNKRKRDDGSPPEHDAKKHKGDEEAEEADDDDDGDNYDDEEEEEEEEEYREEEEQKAYRDQHDLTAQNLVQQAWAQATRVDGTVIVLHSGNHELVCVRHRSSQTLYVSGVIEPHACIEPGYGKLQVGIYVAAIQDTMDRKRQQLALPVSQSGPAGSSGVLISGNEDGDNTRGSGSGRKDGPGHRDTRKGGDGLGKCGRFQDSPGGGTDELALKNMIHEASNRDVVHLYLRYGLYDSPIPALFLRSAPPIMAHTRCPTPPLSPQTTRSYVSEECMSIVVSSEIGQGATGVVHRGTFMPETSDDGTQMDIVVKLAFDIEQRKALMNEYDVYRCLRLKGVHQGVATVLGFFDDSEGAACALVMLYAGVPLSTDSQRDLSVSDCNSALSTLESVHCANILHADIRPENILVSNLGITIIDFGHSKHCDDKRAKDDEFAQLRDLLGLAGKSK